MSELDPAAPAQPEPVLTATEQAAAKDDLPAFNAAWRAERTAPKVPAPAPPETPVAPVVAPAPPAEEPRAVSKRQQQINDQIRLATERAVADRDAEIARLRAQIAPPPAAPAPPAETFPPYADYLTTHPEASLEEYMDARQDHREQVKTRTLAADRLRTEHTQSQHAETAKARERIEAARQADPDFDTKVSPDVLGLRTRDQAIAAQQIPQAENDFATEIATSEYLPQILLLVSEDPTVLPRVRALETRRDVLKFVAKLETRVESAAPAVPVAAPPKTLTNAPEPGTTLGKRSASPADPIAAAVQSDDQAAFNAAWRAKKHASRRA